nr:O-antigen ligase family protein [uncultured Desulfobacter sp.]
MPISLKKSEMHSIFTKKFNKIFLVILFFAIFLGLFISEGEKFFGRLNFYLVILLIIGGVVLAVLKANDKILITGLIFLLTFNSDYPIIYHTQISGGTRPTPEIWLVDLPLIILLFKYFLKNSYYSSPTSPPINNTLKVLFLLFIIWEITTVYVAVNIPSVFFQIVKDIRYFAIFGMLYKFIDNDANKLNFVIIVLFFAITFQNSWGILQFIKQSTFGLSFLGETPVKNVKLDLIDLYTGQNVTIFGLKMGKYISGFAGSAYLLARENLLLFPLFLTMYLSKRYIYNKNLHVFGLSLMLLGLIFGFSKSAWVSALIAVFIILFLEVKHSRLSLWKIRLAGFFSIIIFSVFGKILYLRLFKTNIESSFNGRVFLNEFGLAQFIEHPITGIGANNIWLHFKAIGMTTTVHNLYILFLSEMGLIGFIFFLLILLLILYQTISINKKTPYYFISVGLTASFLSFFWDELWTWLYRFNPIGSLFWALVAVSFSANGIAKLHLQQPSFKKMKI